MIDIFFETFLLLLVVGCASLSWQGLKRQGLRSKNMRKSVRRKCQLQLKH
jgi:hypothetical protein